MGSRRSLPGRAIAMLAALVMPACSLILGADEHYYEVDAGSGGAPMGTTSSSSAGSGASTSTSSSGGSCGSTTSTTAGACGAGTVGEVHDDFDAGLAAGTWIPRIVPSPAASTVTMGPSLGKLVIQADGTEAVSAGYVASAAHTLASCRVSVALVSLAPSSAPVAARLAFVESTAMDKGALEFRVGGDQVTVLRVDDGTTTTSQSFSYDPACHAWLRIRESGGTIYWETSADRTHWHAHHHETAPAWITSGYAYIGLDVPSPLGGQAVTATFDDFNETP